MIGSHNTFSYLPTSKWWMKLLTPWHKCQQWKVYNQIQFSNVKYLDIRVRFNKQGNAMLVHNNITYKTGHIDILNYIENQISTCKLNKPILCRFMLDIRKKPKDADIQISLFKELINKYKQSKYITIDEARIYWDWTNPIIKSKYNIKEIHTSVCSPWYKYILGTKWFARRNNKSIITNNQIINDKTTIYLLDYTNIGI